MTMTKEITTQEAGVPILFSELYKIQLLEEMGCISSAHLLDVNTYSADRIVARGQFMDRFAFHNMITKEELEKVYVLWTQFMDYCVPPVKLIDPRRYSNDLKVARFQFEKRLALYDTFKGIQITLGRLREGKTGHSIVHAKHGRDWFDLPVVTFGFKLPEEFGEYTYVNAESFVQQLYKTTEIVEGRDGHESLVWTGDRGEVMSIFYNGQVIFDEAPKWVPRGSPTRLAKYIFQTTREWGHYGSVFNFITDSMGKLNKEHLVDMCTHTHHVQRNLSMDRTSDIFIVNRITGEAKPIIHLERTKYQHLWQHNSPVVVVTNVSRKFVDTQEKIRKGEVYLGGDAE